MRFFRRCFDSPDSEATIPAVVDNRFTSIEQISSVWSASDTRNPYQYLICVYSFPAPRHIALAGWNPAGVDM